MSHKFDYKLGMGTRSSGVGLRLHPHERRKLFACWIVGITLGSTGRRRRRESPSSPDHAGMSATMAVTAALSPAG
ncbi:MAG TPA: hypothetical protein VEM40_04250 [Nitrospirota bacterium]|nr:hypothetical protein [Nitrospirota bacterium]